MPDTVLELGQVGAPYKTTDSSDEQIKQVSKKPVLRSGEGVENEARGPGPSATLGTCQAFFRSAEPKSAL